MYTIDAWRPILTGTLALRTNGAPTIYRCAPDWFWKPPPLRDYDLWCVLAGRGTLTGSGQTVSLTAGSCCVVPPGAAPHATHVSGSPLTVFAVHFEPDEAFPSPNEILIQQVHDISFLSMLADRCERAGTANRWVQSLALIREILLLILVEAETRVEKPENEQIEELCATIRREPGKNWSVDRISANACLSRSQLTRVFRQQLGVSPTEFVIRCRIDSACQMLTETRRSVTEIAARLGYEDVHYLSRQFKARMGQSPRAYREQAM